MSPLLRGRMSFRPGAIFYIPVVADEPAQRRYILTIEASSMGRSDNRRVKQAMYAWKTGLPDVSEHIPKGTIEPVGEPIVIEPFEEIHLLRWTSVSGYAMALVSWCDTLYLVAEEDLEYRTMRMFRSLRRR